MLDDVKDGSPSQASTLSFDDVWSLLKRHRWHLLVPFFAGWIITFALAFILPAIYKSEGTIALERTVPKDYVVPNVEQQDPAKLIDNISEEVLSRPRLATIIRQMNLYPKQAKTMTPDALAAMMRSDIEVQPVQTQAQAATSTGNGRSSLSPKQQVEEITAFTISYKAPTPKLAREVANQLTQLFVEENQQTIEQQSAETTTFLDSQLQDARQQLEAEDQKVQDFKSKYLGQLPEQVQSNMQILSGLEGRLQSAEEALDHARQQQIYLNSLADQYRSMSASVGMGKNAALPPALDQELAKEKAELADLEARYTDQHPDVVRLKEQIAETEKLKDKIESQTAAAASANPDALPKPSSLAELQAMSPMLQIQSQIKSNKIEIQNRDAEIKSLTAQIGGYESRLNLTPIREQELNSLTRDYNQMQASYDALLAKRNQSQLATNLTLRHEGETFRVVDPPSAPKTPDFPNRLNLSLVGLGIGLALAGIVAGYFELKDDRLYRVAEMKTVAPATVLVMIPPIPTAEEELKRAKRMRVEWMVAAALVLVMVLANLRVVL